jgi:hypothetical protein
VQLLAHPSEVNKSHCRECDSTDSTEQGFEISNGKGTPNTFLICVQRILGVWLLLPSAQMAMAAIVRLRVVGRLRAVDRAANVFKHSGAGLRLFSADADDSPTEDLKDLADTRVDDPERPPEVRCCACGESHPYQTRVSPSPQDELASMHAYHESLAFYWKEEEQIMWKRIDRLRKPSSLVGVVLTFSSLSLQAPELFEKLEGRFLDEVVPHLDSQHLSALAWAYGRQEAPAGSSAFWEAVLARAKQLRPFSSWAFSNLANSLLRAGAAAEADLKTLEAELVER